jgi:CheY-like chemotaxis protein
LSRFPYDFPEAKQNVEMELSPLCGKQAVTERPLVLVVDDNEDNLILLTFLLELLGCAFITAADGQTALDLAQSVQPAVILLDMMLPDFDGIEVFSRLRQNPVTAMIPVIAVTALARAEDRERILSAGCNEYISKPFSIEEIEALLYRYLSQRD